jgi:hypothetical protein
MRYRDEFREIPTSISRDQGINSMKSRQKSQNIDKKERQNRSF